MCDAPKVLSLWRGEIAVAVSMGSLIAEVAKRHGILVSDLTGDSRVRSISRPRQEFMALAYGSGQFSLPRIGGFLGGRDHTTILHGIRAYSARLAAQEKLGEP